MELDAIAFDADDTLWHTERFYKETEQSWLSRLAAYDVSPEEALDNLHRIEIDNLAYFGYGIRGFTFSMIEAAIRTTGNRLRAEDVQAIIELGRRMTSHEIHLMEGVEEALDRLGERRLMLITKGDTLDQMSKLRRSGLEKHFSVVEVVIDKTEQIYAHLLEQHAIDPKRFLMVGNSLRSDITPILALGSYAVYVPYALGWAHEAEAETPDDRERFFEIASLFELPGLIEKIETNGKVNFSQSRKGR